MASPKSPQEMKNLSCTDSEAWSGHLERKWRERGRRLLFRGEVTFRSGLGTSLFRQVALADTTLALVTSNDHYLGSFFQHYVPQK